MLINKIESTGKCDMGGYGYGTASWKSGDDLVNYVKWKALAHILVSYNCFF